MNIKKYDFISYEESKLFIITTHILLQAGKQSLRQCYDTLFSIIESLRGLRRNAKVGLAKFV